MQNSAVSAYKIFIRLCIIRKFYVNLHKVVVLVFFCIFLIINYKNTRDIGIMVSKISVDKVRYKVEPASKIG